MTEQVASQCRVVAHLARALAGVFEDKATLIADGRLTSIVPSIDRRSYALMETLGDILNGMDAVTDEDAWVNPIFEQASKNHARVTPADGGA